MERSSGDHGVGAHGFAYSRREVLKTGGAVGTATALAGCSLLSDDGDDTTATPEQGTQSVSGAELIDDGLAVLSSSFIDDPRRVDLQNDLGREIQTARYVRVRVRNELDDPIGTVTLSVDLFDEQDQFLEVQMATISKLRANEVFEGYIPFRNPAAALYLIRARRSRRGRGSRPMTSLTATDHCLVDDEVRGTITNDGADPVEGFDIRVRYYDNDGNVIGTTLNTVSELAAGESRDFDVALDDDLDGTTETVADYTVEVADAGMERSAIR